MPRRPEPVAAVIGGEEQPPIALHRAGDLPVEEEGQVHERVAVPGLAGAGRVHVGRLAIAGAALMGGLVALVAPTDPLRLLLWSLALSGSTFFPVIVLSIWWKRMNEFGAIAGMSCGFGVAVLTILAGAANILGIDGVLLREFGLAGLMHDIGKVRTPAEILRKPDRLTDSEMSVMRPSLWMLNCNTTRPRNVIAA